METAAEGTGSLTTCRLSSCTNTKVLHSALTKNNWGGGEEEGAFICDSLAVEKAVSNAPNIICKCRKGSLLLFGGHCGDELCGKLPSKWSLPSLTLQADIYYLPSHCASQSFPNQILTLLFLWDRLWKETVCKVLNYILLQVL